MKFQTNERQLSPKTSPSLHLFDWLHLALLIVLTLCCGRETGAQTDWPYVGGDAGGTRYSKLDQITRRNVQALRVAWTFRTGPHQLPVFDWTYPSIQCAPVVVDGVMYLTSADTRVIALEAASGRELWRFDPRRTKLSYLSNRGVAYWSDNRPGGARRILLAI
ncbi:MAG: hypothetical protein WKF30_13205 [Pyrinomonadaceae bacterium]